MEPCRFAQTFWAGGGGLPGPRAPIVCVSLELAKLATLACAPQDSRAARIGRSSGCTNLGGEVQLPAGAREAEERKSLGEMEDFAYSCQVLRVEPDG